MDVRSGRRYHRRAAVDLLQAAHGENRLMPEDCLDKVRQIVADVFNVPAESVTVDSSPESIESWESLTHLNLVLSLEQAFDVSFAPEEIAELTSVAAIVERVQKEG